MVEQAVHYMDYGWSVFPVNGKIPATAHGVSDASGEYRLASVWFERHPNRGIGLATGDPSGVWALDLDGAPGRNSMARLRSQCGSLPQTVTSKTKNGWHLLWSMPDGLDIRNSASKVAEGVDVRGTGGYIVLPPSAHPDGGTYEWVKGRSPEDVQIAEAPYWLLKLVTAQPDRSMPAEQLPDRLTEGSRNDRLASLAGSMRRRGASGTSILAALNEENRLRCIPQLPPDEVEKIAESIARYQPSTNGAPKTVAPKIQLIDAEVLARIGDEKLMAIDAVATPWPAWNVVCRGAGGGQGLAPGWHIIVGASSGAGKSLWATNLAAAAVRAGHGVCMLSLEMSQPEVVTRLLSVMHGKDVRELEHGDRFQRNAWDDASELLLTAPGKFWINHEPVHALAQIEAVVREYSQRGARLAIIDYLQLAWAETAETMYQQITEVSHTIRRLAVELGITTVGLSQVNRQTSVQKGTPVKEGLMGGSSLENDADQVVLLGHPKKEENGYRLDVVLDKNRHGPQTSWPVELDVQTLKMRELLPDEQASYAV